MTTANWQQRPRRPPALLLTIDPDSRFQVLVLVCFVALFSYLAARVGGALVIRPEMIWPVWPGCAFLVAVLLLTPRKRWPVLLIAGLAGFAFYDVRAALPIRAMIVLLIADTIEILIAALGITYVFGGAPRLYSVKALAKYSLFAVILAPIAAGFVGASAYGQNAWRAGFLTEALALLTLTPAILSWVDFTLTSVRKSKFEYLEAALMSIGLLVLSYFAFLTPGGKRPALLYSLVPFLLWSALRFGITGTSTSLVLVAFMSVWGGVHKLGPFLGDTTLDNVLSLQLFLLVTGTSFMLLAAVVEEHRAAEHALLESEQRLRLAAEVGRMFAYSWDATSDAIKRSGVAADILGVNPQEVATGAALSALVHPDDKERLKAAFGKVTVENPTVEITYRIVRPDGIVAWLRSHSQAYFDRNGSLIRMVGMIVDVTERRKAKQALAEMTRRLIAAQEQERARIGRELHDDINQRLAMLAIELQQLQDSPFEVEERVEKLRKRTSEISNDVQGLSHELHPSRLEYLGVVAGIRSWCKEFSEHQGIDIKFKSEIGSPVPFEIGITLFRILQEALHNAAKHSGVKRLEVQLSEQPKEIYLTVSDEGKGFDIEAAKQGRGLGLASMEERVRLINGTIAIASKPMGGTTIRVCIPFASERVPQHQSV